MKKTALVVAVMAMGWMFSAVAADEGSGPPQGGQNKERGKRPPPPVMKVLDVNGDGILDAGEIANAAAALAKLDKNGDGKLTREELMPPRPPPSGDQQGHRGEGEGPQGGAEPGNPPPQEGEGK